MTYQDLIQQGRSALRRADVGEASSEAELLLAHAVGKPKEFVLTHPLKPATRTQEKAYLDLVSRRERHEPVAYLLGYKDFYGRSFLVDEHVLIPRPATETLVEAALAGVRENAAGRKPVIFDVGTGSGTIALSLAAELPEARTVAADRYPDALAVARKNAERFGVADRTDFVVLDVTDPKAEKPDLPPGYLVLTANLPYLSDLSWDTRARDIRDHEPITALVSGSDGLDHYRSLVRRLKDWGLAPDLLLLEADPHQMFPLSKLVHAVLPAHRLEIAKDLGGQDRVLIAAKA